MNTESMAPHAASGADEDPMAMGQQPLDALLQQLQLSNHDLVKASPDQLTHKMVQKGRRGRQLTRHTQNKILAALNSAAGSAYRLEQLFTYRGR